MTIREQLIEKIKTDVDLGGLEDLLTKDLEIFRPTLTWQQKTVGRTVWFWYVHGCTIGSPEGMKALLKSPKLEVYKPTRFDYQILSS
jgi:hypothetical protein